MKFLLKYQHLDQFSKVPQLYIEGYEEKGSSLGIILSIIYFFLSLAISIYFLTRMFSRSDVTVVNSTEYSTKYLTFNVTHDYAYFAFGVEDPVTYDYFIDDTIYYPTAIFKQAIRSEETGEFVWKEKKVPIEPCDLNNFGKRYQNLFENKPVQNMYCITNMTETLEGHFSQDHYSFFMVQLYECKNTTENNNKCKNKTTIDHFLNGTFISVLFESVSIDPKNYDTPAQAIVENFYTTFGKNFFKEIHIFVKIIEIMTDQGFIFTSYKKEAVLQGDTYQDMFTTIPKDSLCDITIKLSNRFDVVKRSYTKIQQVLGNLGGFIKVISTFLSILFSSPIRILFENEIINKLYRFNFSEGKTRRQTNIFSTTEISKIDTTKRELLNNYISKKLSFPSARSSTKTIKEITPKPIHPKQSETIKTHDRIKLSKKEIYFMNLCHSVFKNKKNVILFHQGNFLYKQKMDIFSLFKLFVDFEVVKLLLFDKDQINVLNYNHKPTLFYNDVSFDQTQSKFKNNVSKEQMVLSYKNIQANYNVNQIMKINKNFVDYSNLILS